MMYRLLLKFIALGTAFFSVTIMLIHAQPYDDSELRMFLTPPEGCPAPCFLGIRPGITPADEAVNILEAHDWIGQVDNSIVPYVSWTWSGQQPTIIPAASKGILSVHINRQVVLDVAVQTSLPVAAMYLLNGGPVVESSKVLKRGKVYATVVYPDYSIMTFTNMACPVSARLFWGSPLGIEFINDPRTINVAEDETRTIDLFC